MDIRSGTLPAVEKKKREKGTKDSKVPRPRSMGINVERPPSGSSIHVFTEETFFHHLVCLCYTDFHGDSSLQKREEISCFKETPVQRGRKFFSSKWHNSSFPLEGPNALCQKDNEETGRQCQNELF